jgi:carbon monoxide dehydrogenase subunit G
MTIFKSKTTINKPINEVYQFLADMNNHQRLVPENIQDWSSNFDEARFKIQNMASLALKIAIRAVDSEIKIIPLEKPPFDLELKWVLTIAAGSATEVVFTIAADLNMMMKMLASGPLQKLADHETQMLTKIFA